MTGPLDIGGLVTVYTEGHARIAQFQVNKAIEAAEQAQNYLTAHPAAQYALYTPREYVIASK